MPVTAPESDRLLPTALAPRAVLEDRYAQTVSYTPRQPSSIEVRMRLIGFRQLTHTLSCRSDSIVPGPQEPSRALAHSNS
jgi:hypothetical protein